MSPEVIHVSLVEELKKEMETEWYKNGTSYNGGKIDISTSWDNNEAYKLS